MRAVGKKCRIAGSFMNPNSSTNFSISSPSADAISRRAYELWEQEGRPEGADLRHWIQAEQELRGRPSENTLQNENATTTPRNTGTDTRPLPGTRAAAVNRDTKRGPAAPANSEKNSAPSASPAAKRKSPSTPAL
jgi:hypothetical protein